MRSAPILAAPLAFAALSTLVTCHRAPTRVEARDPHVSPAVVAVAAPAIASRVGVPTGRRASVEAHVNERIDIPAGRVTAGSTPGDDGRDPSSEPVASTYAIPAFSIDALPYPNDPAQPPLLGASMRDAEAFCAAKRERLCTELEWERACRGPDGDAFSTGTTWDATCATTPSACTSGFGARGLGDAFEEWTRSEIASDEAGKDDGKKGVKLNAVRGSLASKGASAHRCAARHLVDPTAKGRAIGFRCCAGGDTNGPQMLGIATVPSFTRTSLAELELSGGKLGELFAQIPELQRVKGSPRLFQESDVAEVTDAGKRPSEGHTLTVDPIRWSPEPGAELVVLTGHSKGGAFVVALHHLPDHRFRLASSLIFANEQGPIALSYQSNIRREIGWSMCWGCAGEGGAVTYRDDHRVVIVQR